MGLVTWLVAVQKTDPSDPWLHALPGQQCVASQTLSCVLASRELLQQSEAS